MEEVIGIAEGWNAGFLEENERPVIARDYLWASELGNAPIDLFLRLKGEVPTNPPNDRAKRKMGAGVDWEYTIEQIFKSAGILLDSQVRCEHQYPEENGKKFMRVSGKLDFLIGGVVDMEAANKYLQEGVNYISENRRRAAKNTIRYYQQKYPDGFEKRPIEFKSISDYAMDEMEKSMAPVSRHKLQLFHYIKSLNYKLGTLSYLNRNDERMIEFTIGQTEGLEAEYKNKIGVISDYYYRNEQPPLEKYLIWDEGGKKFSKNLNISYSYYLTKLYGFKEPREYDEPAAKKATQWNSLLARVKKGAKMTPKNLEWRSAIEAEGYNVDELVAKLPDTVEAEEENGNL